MKQSWSSVFCERAGEQPDLCAPGQQPTGILPGSPGCVSEALFLVDLTPVWPPSPMPPAAPCLPGSFSLLAPHCLGEEDQRVLDLLPGLLFLLRTWPYSTWLDQEPRCLFDLQFLQINVFDVFHPEFLVAFSG